MPEYEGHDRKSSLVIGTGPDYTPTSLRDIFEETKTEAEMKADIPPKFESIEAELAWTKERLGYKSEKLHEERSWQYSKWKLDRMVENIKRQATRAINRQNKKEEKFEIDYEELARHTMGLDK